MDLSLERDSSALGSLFQQIINDMKNTSPLWEDFVAKASKLHACLRAAIQAIAAYLDAFQKIADAATNSRGASKEIGTALTRVCLRHKAVETRLKTFTAAIMDYLVQPLQDKLEDWKRTAATIDKEHAKEYKRCRTELKKRSTDTLRLQKKARKGQTDTLQTLMDSHMQDVTLRRAELEEVEKKSLRSVMIEERMRYCTFVHMLQPVVKEECEVMSELGHLQEAMQSIAIVTKDPNVLPQSSEELILDAKATMTLYPESPVGGSGSQGGCSNSLGSRKSSVCSISSMNSSGSSSSPGHHQYQRSLSQLISPAIRLKPGESSDSGFCSSPALTTQASTATSQSHAVSTWPPHSQDVATMPPAVDRPHTISTTYEKGHQRPPLTVYTFQNPETILESGPNSGSGVGGNSGQNTPSTQKPPANNLSRPPLPVRCSSLERPLVANNNRNGGNLAARQCPSPIPAHITKELSMHQAQQQQQLLQQQQLQQQNPPTYVNMSELANMAALKMTNHQQQQQQQQQPLLQQQHSIDSISSQLSNESSTSNTQPQHHQAHQKQHSNNTRSHSTSSSVSSNTPSLRSHPSIESAVATPLVGQTPTPSSGSSTPQNPYSPLLTNSPSSTAVGTPSGASITSNTTGQGFVYNVCSPTPPPSATLSTASDVLKITELDGIHNPITPTNDADSPPTDAESVVTYQTPSNDTDSPTIVENDERSRASVLQKASMFEKQAAAAAQPAPAAARAVTPADSGIYGTSRAPEHYRASPVQQPQYEQQEVDKSFEDSIQELNNLIGELDSFQREIDAGKQSSNTNNKIVDHFAVEGGNETIISDNPCQTRGGMISQPSQPYCPSNQTNSSGCGTDISDTTSDEIAADTRSLTSLNFNSNCSNIKQNCNYNSDSELSRCYVSETSSLTGGYENPTFAHFASTTSTVTVASIADDAVSDSRSLLNADSISHVGDTLSMTHRHAYIDNGSDCGSGVVVIYDHQIPITPDMDYAKQNSEIVVLRTKDPQQLPMSEMRELQQLPANLCDTPESPTTPSVPQTATVAPAKQRLSSFRASSEQQLQLLGGGHSNSSSMSNLHRQQQQQHEKGTQDGRNSLKGLTKVEIASMPATATTTPSAGSDTIIRRKLPPKPNLSIFNGSASPNLEVNSNSSRVLLAQNQQQHEQQQQHPIPTTPTPPQPPPLVSAMKLDFRADLDSKIRKQKQKLLQQERQQQAQQQHSSQQRKPQPPLPSQSPSTNANNTHINNNCNNSISNKHASAASSPSIVNASNISKTNNAASNPASTNSLTSNHHIYTNGSLAKLPQNQNHSHQHTYHSNSPQTYSPLASPTVKPTLSPSVSPAVPSNYSSSASASAHVPAVTVSASSSASTSKPSITPRPASLSGGTTRIARRSSVNAAKPPPPIRRSSSVTPSHNVASGPQKHQPTTANSNLLHQQQNLMNNSTESLPPPPAYLLDTRQTHSTPTSPPSVMPHSAQKVAETVKALSAMRHQPASPHALRHLHHNQQQHQQQPVLQIQTQATLYSASTITNSCDEPDYMGYHNPYVEIEAFASLPACHSKTAANYVPLQTSFPPPPQLDYSSYNALPPPPAISAAPIYDHYALTPHTINQQPSNHNQQLQLKRQHNPTKEQQQIHQQPRPQQPYQPIQQLQPQTNNSDAIYGNSASFRTSSPGIYAQPKISNNMSSFRTSSPGPNGHHIHQPQAHHPHQMPPAQPKTNPNLIAQLNARLSKQQPQQENTYGSTPSSPQHHYHNQAQQQHQEPIYYGAHQHPLPPQTQPTLQQQHYDDYASTNIEKTGSIRSKTKAEFLENLNAKLAKQGMSGRAFAVRNLINSKALPDPRICHESLMDQIKRGATLKRNQKINDRSAPKIL